MKKIALVLGAFLLFLPVFVTAQNISDRFSELGAWRAAQPGWTTRAGRLVQPSVTEPMARIDRQVAQNGVFTVEFDIRYEDVPMNGYASESALTWGAYHGGFGIHLGVKNPALGRTAWGNGESYLLWLNLDTRPETLQNYPEHYGLRGQVYRSTNNTTMSLLREADFAAVYGDDRVSVDIPAALGVTTDEMMEYLLLDGWLDRNVRVTMTVDTNTGEITIVDPTNPRISFFFFLEPDLLKGDYVSLRTNKLAVSYGGFSVTRR